MLLSMQRREASCNSSTLRGRTNHLAGPPSLNQVNFASGAFSVTNCSRPAKGPVMRINGADTELAFCVSTVPTFPCDGRAVRPPAILPTYEFAAHVTNISCSHGHNQISVPHLAPQILHDLRQLGHEQRPLAMPLDSFHQIARAHTRSIGLAVAHRINLRHERQVRIAEAGRKIVEQKARAAVLMRLKNTNQS